MAPYHTGVWMVGARRMCGKCTYIQNIIHIGIYLLTVTEFDFFQILMRENKLFITFHVLVSTNFKVSELSQKHYVMIFFCDKDIFTLIDV